MFRLEMSSRAGPRAQGTDGTDYLHRQRVAAHYQESANNKFILKFFYAAHLGTLFFMWAKVGSEILKKQFDVKIALMEKLDLPSAYEWEYLYCFSFVAIIMGLLAFPKNKVKLIDYHYYAQFLLGVLPCIVGMASQLPEVFDYFSDPEKSKTPTFKGFFPMVFIWYVFFIVALQIHIFAMHFSYQLSQAWTPMKNKKE